MRICIVQPVLGAPSETFLKAHADYLPGEVTVVHGYIPHIGETALIPNSLPSRALRRLRRIATKREDTAAFTRGYLRAFELSRPDVVLAEFGPIGVRVMDACRQAHVPLVVNFLGHDASAEDTLAAHKDTYPLLFEQAKAILGGSEEMCRRLVELGAPPEKIHLNHIGVDCAHFGGSDPAHAPPTFLSVGRLVGKKAPHLVIMAFALAHRSVPEARLRMVGGGDHDKLCLDLIRDLRLGGSVDMLGVRSHEFVMNEMRQARALVQHSMVAWNGDSEGTALTVVEAGASGLPVVATRHGGIRDVVVEGETGFLVDERDFGAMGDHIVVLARDAELAGRMGRAARERVSSQFSMEERIGHMAAILAAAAGQPAS